MNSVIHCLVTLRTSALLCIIEYRTSECDIDGIAAFIFQCIVQSVKITDQDEKNLFFLEYLILVILF